MTPPTLRTFSATVVICGLLLGSLWAKDKAPEPANKPPRIVMIVPLGIARGVTAKVIIRGVALDSATEVHATAEGTDIPIQIKSKGKAEVIKDAPPEKMGDTQVEVELKIPVDSSANEAAITVTTPNGTSEPHSLRLFDPADLTVEKEPNGAFATAQEVTASTTVQGSISPENDVDVVKITGKAGQKVSAEIFAARLGSALDSLLTLYDEQGHAVATNDDSETADSAIRLSLPHDGVYFLSLTDANGKGGVMFPYLLRINLK
ncbi:MAG TPA: PPC domain-containing protein [Tepidisphaeraceae bacterium]|nr:PPC domain-containing protein [Tepidisphaeraceae bacterium]